MDSINLRLRRKSQGTDADDPQETGNTDTNYTSSRFRSIQKCLFITITIIVAVVIFGSILYVSLRKTYRPVLKYELECIAGQNGKEACLKAGCKWSPSQDPDVPNCFLPPDTFGFHLKECLVDESSCDLHVAKGSFYGGDFQQVNMKIVFISNSIVRIQFIDKEVARYQVPIEINSEPKEVVKNEVYDITFTTDPEELFSFKVSRKEDGTVIFDSSVGALFLAEHHIEVTTILPSRNLYGIGETTHKTYKNNFENYNKWPVFSRDQGPDPWDGAGRYNLYGVHPYYMCLEDSGKAHGVLFLNSNAMEFTLTPMPALNFRSSGGILDMFFFVGNDPEHVTQLYTEVVGRPMIPPYWGLGFQLSRFGYNSLETMQTVINRTRDKGFPLDVAHADIDAMADRKDFTWDEKRFPKFNEFVKNEKAQNGLHFIVILDPALLATDRNYKPYKDGENANVYIKWSSDIPKDKRTLPPFPDINNDKDIMFGLVWPGGPVAFPDFFKSATKTWWKNQIGDYRRKLNFDALWIDMNEPTNFATKLKDFHCSSLYQECWMYQCPENKYDNPSNTFVPAATSVHGPKVKLSENTLCMAGVQGDKDEYVRYNVHSLYGWSQIEATYMALRETAKAGQVPLIISRSTYVSSGRHAGHWLGDNMSTWNSMRSSIVGMLEFNLFGIPYIGADICGFNLNSESELCGRWMQLGAFYPFSRNHNRDISHDQDPGSSVLNDRDRERARTAMVTRYQLLPYLHTLHYQANTKGNTVVRALFHEFCTDSNTYEIQEQFMWGRSLLISPVLYKGATTLDVYLPDDLWYDFYQGALVNENGRMQKIRLTNLEVVPLHVRGGSILPLKETGARNTRESRQKNFEIHIYPKNSTASGDLYWTAEEANDLENPKSFRVYNFQFDKNQFLINLISKENLEQPNKQVISKIVVYNQDRKPESMTYQSQELNGEAISYDDNKKILTITYQIDLEELKPNSDKDQIRILQWQ